jgi:hypothetical protein
MARWISYGRRHAGAVLSTKPAGSPSVSDPSPKASPRWCPPVSMSTPGSCTPPKNQVPGSASCAGVRSRPGAAWRSVPTPSFTPSPCRRRSPRRLRLGGARVQLRAACISPTPRPSPRYSGASPPPPSSASSASGPATASPGRRWCAKGRPLRRPYLTRSPTLSGADRGLEQAAKAARAIPDAVRGGPLVELPNREYLLYEGPVEPITATASLGHGQTANLAWPADHAWCLASEIDLAWTYVGGSEPLVERLLADERVECLPAGADDPLTRIEPFVAALVERGVEELLASGHTVIATSMGTVEAWLERPTRLRPGALRVRSERFDGGRGGGGGPVHRSQDLRKAATFRLTEDVVGLVGG